MSALTELAYAYAQFKHRDQKRKYTGDPYFFHCAEVANHLECMHMPEHVVAAGYLHDVVEDTDATLDDIERIFGKDVAKLVEEVTDVSKPEDGNRAIRKEIDRNHLAKASAWGKTIKLADLISNTHSIVERDLNFAKVYLAEKERLLEILIGGHGYLYNEARELLEDSKNKLKSALSENKMEKIKV